MNRLWISTLLTLLLAFIAQSVPAQTKVLTTEELTRRADVVAVGKVAALTSEWNENRTSIRTRVVLAVDQYVKGTGEGGTLTIYVPGGEVGEVGEIYSHMPTFRSEENVVVFAEKDKQNHFRVSAGQQGKLTVKHDDFTGVPMVSERKTLQQFKAEVRTIAASQK